MKQVLAIVLLCLPTALDAEARCSTSRANRDEVARIASARPMIGRAMIPRAHKVRLSPAWQRVLLVEQQIL